MKFAHKIRIPLFVVFYMTLFALFAVLSLYVSGAVTKNDVEKYMSTAKNYKFATDMTYVDMPRMNISMNSDYQTAHMQIDLALEVTKKDEPILRRYLPVVTSGLYLFFNGLSPAQVQPARSLPWLRGEILKKVNNMGLPVPVHEVMLRRLIVTADLKTHWELDS